MPKFKPRQRKHKVLARSKGSNDPENDSNHDTNALEVLPIAQTEKNEKKRLLKEQIAGQESKISGKKAKRLDKYIENKLRKDENRELLEKLGRNTTDTSLFLSSRKLGQGRETKRERYSRIFREQKAGLDLNGEGGDIYEKKSLRETGRETTDSTNSDGDDDDDEYPNVDEGSTSHDQIVEQEEAVPHNASNGSAKVSIGGGLKRPLQIDDSGKPILKKRKRRGGLKRKAVEPDLSSTREDELDWEGFSSQSNGDSDNEPLTSKSSKDRVGATMKEGDEDADASDLGVISDSSRSQISEGNSESRDSRTEDEDENEKRKIRSSAFKSWATQQVNTALGYQNDIKSDNISEMPISVNFKPRSKEEEPLPVELQTISGVDRKVFSVPVARTPEIQEARLKLPVVAEEQKIMEAIHNNNIVVIYGATGSGKTTQVPQFLFEAGYGCPTSPTPGKIGVTQPRRVAAVSMSKRVGDELAEHHSKVAYQIRFEGTVSDETAIKFMTDGVLLREVALDISLRKYSAIIIDEAHERSVNTDILIGMLSRIVRLREELHQESPSLKPLKLIIMSATLRIKDFTHNTTLFSTPPPVLQAEGRQYPVTDHFARRTNHDYVDEAFKKISKGHKKLPPGGFLVFLTGQNEIRDLMNRLKDQSTSTGRSAGPNVRISGHDASIEVEDLEFGGEIDDLSDFDDAEVEVEVDDDEAEFEVEEDEAGPAQMHILPLYSLLPTKDQLKVFEPPPDGARLVVLATNVAETSLTIPGIRYVFDSGRSKERKFNHITGVQSFEISWISKASAAQRAGRAGRTGTGHCYKLYSSAVYERDFEEFAVPEILRTPIEGVVLQLKAMNLQHVINFPFPTPPDKHTLMKAERLLSYLSAISISGQVTSIGQTMSIFPLSPRFARILLIGHLHDCIHYAIAMVAGLSAADVIVPESQAIPQAKVEDGKLFTNADRLMQDQSDSVKRRYNRAQKEFCFLDDRSDAIKLLQVVGEFAHEPTETWCQQHFVRHKVLKEISQLRRQITDLLRTNIQSFVALKFQEKLDPPSPKQVKALKQMVAAGFIEQIAIRTDLSPTPPDFGRKPSRAIDVPYLTLLPSYVTRGAGDSVQERAVFIHPSSPMAHLSTQECPEFIVYKYLQKPPASLQPGSSTPKTRMHALTDVSGTQVAALTKDTPLLTYGKPIKEVAPKVTVNADQASSSDERVCWVIPYLRAEGVGGMGWPLPAKKVRQKKIPGKGWVVQ